MTERGRSRAWHAAAGLCVGAACTIATVPFATGVDTSLALALLVCSPALSAVIGVLVARPTLATKDAMGRAAGLAPIGGALNMIAVVLLASLLQGAGPDSVIAAAISTLAAPFVGVWPGLVYSGPLAVATQAARRGLPGRADPSGRAGRLVAVVGVFMAAASTFALACGGTYPLWPVITSALGVCAAACAARAADDLHCASRLSSFLGRWASRLRIEEGSVDGVVGIAPWVGPPNLDVMVVDRLAQGAGPYRASSTSRPMMALAGRPEVVVRRLRLGAALHVVLALVLTAQAAGVSRLGPPWWAFDLEPDEAPWYLRSSGPNQNPEWPQ